MIKDNEKRQGIVVELYKKVVESRGGDSGLDNLNLLKLDYSYRARYEKDDSGAVVSKIMDRGFIGLLGSKITETLDKDKIYTCFVYGKKTLGAYIDENKLLCNVALQDSSDFNVLMMNLSIEKGLSISWVEGLPTGKVERKISTGGGLDSCLANIKTIDSLSSELGF